MKTFTGWQYLLIDAANQYGHDKKTFEFRIQWATNELDILESKVAQADNKPLYNKAVMAIRKAQAALPSGHLVGFDACCSGIQLMSVLSGCVSGAKATGLVDPNARSDAYGEVTNEMGRILGSNVNVTRQEAKEALMTSFYGSKAKPIEIFGDETPELEAFYKAASTIAPGAWELINILRGTWQPFALVHEWKLPDGFDARVKVMDKVEARIEVDELEHTSFTYEFYENKGKAKGLSNIANVIHSVDAYVLRSIHRRCNYNLEVVEEAAVLIEMEMIKRSMNGSSMQEMPICEQVDYYIRQYERSGMADVAILPYLTAEDMDSLVGEHLEALAEIVDGMLKYRPFEVVTIHDEFKCHPNNMNYLRQQYINVMAEIADSNLLQDLLNQLTGNSVKINKLSNNLSGYIKQSNYGLS